MSDVRPLDLNNWTDRRRYNDFLRVRDDKARRAMTQLWYAVKAVQADPDYVETCLQRATALLTELEDEPWPTI